MLPIFTLFTLIMIVSIIKLTYLSNKLVFFVNLHFHKKILQPDNKLKDVLCNYLEVR